MKYKPTVKLKKNIKLLCIGGLKKIIGLMIKVLELIYDKLDSKETKEKIKIIRIVDHVQLQNEKNKTKEEK